MLSKRSIFAPENSACQHHSKEKFGAMPMLITINKAIDKSQLKIVTTRGNKHTKYLRSKVHSKEYIIMITS